MSSVTSSEDHQSHTLYKKPSIHRRNNSGELDVFEAANYFSLASNMTIHEHQHQPVSSHKPNKENFTTKSYKEHVNDHAGRSKGGRMSLDVVGRSSKIKVTELKSLHKVHDDDGDDDEQVVKMMKKNNKPKQPSSPGGRLASFLTSLFNHSTSKKKKSLKQDDQIQMKPRMRRSSISHVDSRSLYLSASATGFRTPPPVNKTYFDDSKSLQDHKRVMTAPSKSLVGLLEQRPKISNGLFSLSGHDKSLRNSTNGFGEKDKVYGHEKIEFEFKKFDNNVTKLELHKVQNKIDTVKHIEFKKQIKDEEEEDGGDESDTSSDLFELPNYDLGEFPSELPVYEFTNVEKIKSSAKPDSK